MDAEDTIRFEVGKMYFNVYGNVCQIVKRDFGDMIVFKNLDTGKFGKLCTTLSLDRVSDRLYESIWLGRKYHYYEYLNARKVL